MKLGIVIPYSEDRGEQAERCIDSFIGLSNDYVISLARNNDTPFAKTKALNMGIAGVLDEGADMVSIVDVDMIYSESFIPTLLDYYANGKNQLNYIISNGYYMTKGGAGKSYAFSNEEIQNNLESFVTGEEQMNTKLRVYASQVTLTKEAIELIFKVLNTNKLFDERFVGWGREDSLFRDTLTELIKYGALKRKYLDNMWFHMYHEKGIKNEANETLYQSEKVIMKQKISDYYGKG